MSSTQYYKEVSDSQLYNRRLNKSGGAQWEADMHEDTMSKNNTFFSSDDRFVPKPLYRPLPDDFQPSIEVLDYLERFHKIPSSFIDMHLLEFKLYWNETKELHKAWQSKFKSHVIHQWKRQQNEANKTSYKSTIESLTDYQWAQGISFDEEDI
jgi:hypothetical protein